MWPYDSLLCTSAPEGSLGAIGVPLGEHLGSILVSIWEGFRIILGQLRGPCGYVWRCVWMCVEMVWKCVDICVDVVWKCVDKCDADAVACVAMWRSVENGVEKRMFKCGKSVVYVCGSLHTNLHTSLHTSVEVVHLSLHTRIISQ